MNNTRILDFTEELIRTIDVLDNLVDDEELSSTEKAELYLDSLCNLKRIAIGFTLIGVLYKLEEE